MLNLFITNPLEQFQIYSLIEINVPLLGFLELSLTNIGFYFILVYTILISLSVLSG
ncbi:ATP synthase F0 subunit a, partial (mitochondrion) [Neolecta irregularis DAH-3]